LDSVRGFFTLTEVDTVGTTGTRLRNSRPKTIDGLRSSVRSWFSVVPSVEEGGLARNPWLQTHFRSGPSGEIWNLTSKFHILLGLSRVGRKIGLWFIAGMGVGKSFFSRGRGNGRFLQGWPKWFFQVEK